MKFSSPSKNEIVYVIPYFLYYNNAHASPNFVFFFPQNTYIKLIKVLIWHIVMRKMSTYPLIT